MSDNPLNATELLTQFQLTEEDLQRVRRFHEQQVDVNTLIDDFYTWLRKQVWYDQYFAHGVPPKIQSLQNRYWQSFLCARVDDNYVAQREKVGQIHAVINLPVTAYLAGMNFAQLWFAEQAAVSTEDTDARFALLASISKLIQLDSNIVMHVYAMQSLQAVKRQGEMTQNIVNEAVRVVRLAATGDFDCQYQPQHETDALAKPINRMVSSLKRFSEEKQKENWLQTGIADLAVAMRGGLAIETLCDNVISFLARYLQAQVGVFYVVRDDGSAELSASYAFTRRKSIDNRIAPGDGLVGQALKEKKTILLDQVPTGYLTVRSGTGELQPANIIVQPLVYENAVRGIVELGAFAPFNDDHLEFLQYVGEAIAIAIKTALDQDTMHQLLRESRETSEQLQRQQQALETANSTLAEQAKALKVSEEELTAQRDMLEESNRELQLKTRDLEQQTVDMDVARGQLEEKATQLALTSRYKSEFLANMSHELRTPLNSLLLLSQALMANKDGNLNDEQIEDVRIIHSGGQSLLSLINEILDLSKVEAGKMRTVAEVVDLASLCQKMRDQFNPMARERGLGFTVDLEAQLESEFISDGQRLEQILRNLLSNAFKFTHDGSVQLSVAGVRGVESETGPGDGIQFRVRDTGIGIAEENRNAIFEAFQQADGSTSRAYGGTGLGLTISRELAGLLGGRIALHSQEDKGSEFSLILPLRPAAKKALTSAPVTRNPESPPIPAAADSAILVVSDDREMYQTLDDMAGERGYPTVRAGHQEDLRRVLSQVSPAAIMLDGALAPAAQAHLDAYLQAQPHPQSVPVHQWAMSEQERVAARANPLAVLNKPVTEAALENVINQLTVVAGGKVNHVLLVEDDKPTRGFIENFLSDRQIAIASVATGEQALAYLRSQPVDCWILDINLPDMTGFELLAAINDDPDLSMPPMVVNTARELSSDEYKLLFSYTDKIVIKSRRSGERLRDEVLRFLAGVQQEEAPSPAAAPSPPREPLDLSALHGRKILLVDDDLRNVYALSKVLREQGLVVILADNGQLAVEKLEQERDVDLVLMDIMMPIMDGYEAIKVIRGRISESLPIIALTAKAMSSDREKCLSVGASDYMAKPVDLDDLLSVVKNWCYH